MPSRFSSGKNAIAECDRCGFRYKLTELKNLVIKTKNVSIKVCPTCWEPDQPQLQLGLYPVNDPQAVREPRPDVSYYTAGPLIGGDGGSRQTQWGWNPVGKPNPLRLSNVPNDLSGTGSMGTATVLSGPDHGYTPGGPLILYTPVYTDSNGIVWYNQLIEWSTPSAVPSPSDLPFTSYQIVTATQSNSVPASAVSYTAVDTTNPPPSYNGTVGLPSLFPQGQIFGTLSVYAIGSNGYVSPAAIAPASSTVVPGSSAPLTVPTNVYYTLGAPYPDPLGTGIVYVDAVVYWSLPIVAGVSGTISYYIFNGVPLPAGVTSASVKKIVIPTSSVFTITAVDTLGNVGTVYSGTIVGGYQTGSSQNSSGTINTTTITLNPSLFDELSFNVGDILFGTGIAHGATITNSTYHPGFPGYFVVTVNLPNTSAVSGTVTGYRMYVLPTVPTNLYMLQSSPYISSTVPYAGVTVVDVTFYWSPPASVGVGSSDPIYEFTAPGGGIPLPITQTSTILTLRYTPGTVNNTEYGIYVNNGALPHGGYASVNFLVQNAGP